MAELSKLLGFMSAWDRRDALAKYDAMFDEAADEAELIDTLGSPTKLAIGLALNYVPSPPPAVMVAETAERLGPEAERHGSIDRVTAERHGAIRVGTPTELAQVARIFGACGMHPFGCYDLREADPPIPVLSTANNAWAVVRGEVLSMSPMVIDAKYTNLGVP